MNIASWLRSRFSTRAVVLLAAVVTGIAIGLVAVAVDPQDIRDVAGQARDEPFRLVAVCAAFGAAFVLRSVAWRLVLPKVSFGHALAGIHVALGGNHVLPLRLGEPLRVLSVVRRSDVSVEAATASTVTLRAADLLAVVALGVAVAPAAFFDVLGALTWLALALTVVALVVAWRWLARVAARRSDVRLPGPVALGLSAFAWVLESALVWQSAQWAGIDATWSDAMLVTTVAVASQVVAIAPGGIGTYEAAAVAAYVALGHDAELALAAALSAHAIKTAYSLLVGLIGVFAPSPSLVGRLRLRAAENAPETQRIVDDAPVILFMPAYNEEAAVGACVRRAPEQVLGRRVDVLVIDDGSADDTAARAGAAGAEVISLPENRGLGAAVRVGMQAGVERGAAAVVFCDADGEYPPEELENLVRPILDDEADYVVGSRFLGTIEHMRPHRRFGNHVLTRTLSFVARRRISDGQTGYRAFSPTAAADAEIIHDFNYAQVITLDLLGKGYRYLEVPISYHFRTTGESFIKLGRYLRNVVPAVYRELNTVEPATVSEAQPH
ncbi:MAG: lysylphosphatidylglycerol synthase domain-containing protein [Actinomycetota bacterium]